MALGGCNSAPQSVSTAPAPEPGDDAPEGLAAIAEPPTDPNTKIAGGRTDKELRGCASDGDCVVSCSIDGDCCGQLCGCTQVYAKDFAAELQRHHESCDRESCPVAGCARPTERTVGLCQEGLCVGQPRSVLFGETHGEVEGLSPPSAPADEALRFPLAKGITAYFVAKEGALEAHFLGPNPVTTSLNELCSVEDEGLFADLGHARAHGQAAAIGQDVMVFDASFTFDDTGAHETGIAVVTWSDGAPVCWHRHNTSFKARKATGLFKR